MRRHIPLEGQPNFRDLGGYATTDGRTVAWGRILRSGELSRLTAGDVHEVIEVIGLRRACDLRTQLEVDHSPNPVLAPEAIAHIPIGNPTAADPTSIAAAVVAGDLTSLDSDMPVQGNRLMILEHSDDLARALDVVLDPDSWPVMINCTAGKDRTGLVSAFSLLALGVPRETVIADYLLSSTLLADSNAKRVAGIRNAIAKQRGCAPDDITAAELEPLRALMDVRPHYIAAAFDTIDQEYGSFEVYSRDALRLDDDRVEQFRAAMLD